MCGTIATPDLSLALRDYRDWLGLRVIEDGPLAADLAASWGCAALADAPHAVLQPVNGAQSCLRLIEQPIIPDFQPTRTFGWAAYEISVQDVFGWPERLRDSGFDIVGPPREIPGLPYFVAMQMLGRGREMIYLNEVRQDTPAADLPRASSPVDRLFIVILAAPNREATVAWYREQLGFEEAERHLIPYTAISRAFDLPIDTLHELSMAQVGRMPIIEIDDYPPAASSRPRETGKLPPGNSLVTLAVDRLDRVDGPFIAAPQRRPSPPYAKRLAATIIGSAGELLELVEVG